MSEEKVNIEKPITIVRQETAEKIVNVINESGLQPWILEPILNDALIEIRKLSKKQYEFDKAQYEKSLAEKNDK